MNLKFCGLVLICFLCWNCAKTDPAKIYLLTAKASTPLSNQPSQASFGIAPVVIPAYIDKPQLVSRISEHELTHAEFHRWAEPLSQSIPMVVAENLATYLATDKVFIHPWPSSIDFDYKIRLEIRRFDRGAANQVHLEGMWYVTTNKANDMVRMDRFSYTQGINGEGPEFSVQAKSVLLERLSQDVSRFLATLAPAAEL